MTITAETQIQFGATFHDEPNFFQSKPFFDEACHSILSVNKCEHALSFWKTSTNILKHKHLNNNPSPHAKLYKNIQCVLFIYLFYLHFSAFVIIKYGVGLSQIPKLGRWKEAGFWIGACD